MVYIEEGASRLGPVQFIFFGRDTPQLNDPLLVVPYGA
jgi:hypothetical protein